MVDFLQKNPYVTKEQYLWGWSVPQIKLASYDFTHVVYTNGKKHKARHYDTLGAFLKDSNIDVIDDENKKKEINKKERYANK